VLFRSYTGTPSQGETAAHYHLISPEGIDEIVQPKARVIGNVQTGLSFTLPRLNTPGVYELKNGTTLSALVPINTDPLESDMKRIAEGDMNKFFAARGIPGAAVHEIKPGDTMQDAILQSRFGIELWKYCAGLALLLLLLEMILARDSGKGIPQTAS
jgi:hypothetical protein